jgi:hypothetical protein
LIPKWSWRKYLTISVATLPFVRESYASASTTSWASVLLNEPCARSLGTKPDEPRVERQAALAVACPELGRARLAGDLDRQVDEVVGVPDRHRVAGRVAHDLRTFAGTFILWMILA